MPSFARAAKRLFLLTFLGCASIPPLSLVAAANPTRSGWRSDLDWDGLASKLSSSASLIDTSPKNYSDECLPEFLDLTASTSTLNPNATHHALIDQPSGMCLNLFSNGWEMSWPRPSNNSHMNETFNKTFEIIYDWEVTSMFMFNETETYSLDENNQSLDLPSKVLFPKLASDVIKTVKFAQENSIELSVKNSGHSYSGASSKKNTLLLNMNQYVQYASPNGDGISDCDATLSDATVADDFSIQACLLALARGKSSLIRVGGGENFDKVYRALVAANQALDEYKYHLVGGAAGTVSPMGWTFQGGHAGTTGGRMYGMGLDQVLQVEMVLPNGYHIKFGPTEWEDASADGFVVPRTKVVSGVCRSNPDEEDEEKWIWEACPEDFDIDFGDLWFAVRGGGGGTWGVVTSVSLQLHPYLPYKYFSLLGVEECPPRPTYDEFAAKYLMTPSVLNVTKERNLACGTTDGPNLFCYGDEDVLGAWTRFLELNNLQGASACVVRAYPDAKSYPEALLMGEDSRFPGKVGDHPGPDLVMGWASSNVFGPVLVPQSWIDESEENIKVFLENGKNLYYSHGVATQSFSDQANSLSKTQRDAAVMKQFFYLDSDGEEDQANFWSNLFPKMYANQISDKTNFPAVFNANHAGPMVIGPQKKDWTKACPWEWTIAERKEKCISSQEAIYGTELLKRLEAIKMAVDPNFMFNCHNCIGNNLDLTKASQTQDDESVPPTTMTAKPSDEPSSASVASFYAAAISATVLYLFLPILI